MEEHSTQAHVDDALKRLLGDHAPSCLSDSIQALVSNIKTTATIFILHLNGTGGDLRPFYSFINKLVTTYPARYYVCLRDSKYRLQRRIPAEPAFDQSITLFDDAQSFMRTMESSKVDVIITNQLAHWERNPECTGPASWTHLKRVWIEKRALMLEYVTGEGQQSTFANHISRIEHMWANSSLNDRITEWYKDLKERRADMEEYRAWRAAPEEESFARNQSKIILPRVEFQTYPAELLTPGELGREGAVLAGHIVPFKPSGEADTHSKIMTFIENANQMAKRVVFVCRGGLSDNDDDMGTLTTALRKIQDIIVVGQRRETNLQRQTYLATSEKVLHVWGEIDHSTIFPCVDIVIHHGEYGPSV